MGNDDEAIKENIRKLKKAAKKVDKKIEKDDKRFENFLKKRKKENE